jgi:hypothetical protein
MSTIDVLHRPVKPYFDNNPDNLGAKLESDVYHRVISMDKFDIVLHEKDLVSQYGWECSSIDQLMILGDYMIPIQLKWRRTRRRETQGIEHFIKSVQYIKNIIKKEVLFGIWSSRMMPFADNKEWLLQENIVSVSFFDDINGLVERTIDVIHNKLQECHH